MQTGVLGDVRKIGRNLRTESHFELRRTSRQIEVRPEGREPLPDKAGESTLLSRSGGEKGLRGGGSGKPRGHLTLCPEPEVLGGSGHLCVWALL